MCKLYALQSEITRDEAAKKIADKVKIIKRTEDDGLGIVVQVENQTAIWQCGEAIFDAKGHDVLSILDEHKRMATIAIHGRTSTSKNTTVEHSHPRHTNLGPLMHNGVVRPINDKPFADVVSNGPENWLEKYELDTDYLAELVNRGLIEEADKYLNGYAAIILVQNDETLVVQNQGASLYMNIKHGEVEFGTTMELCPGGNRFESMRAQAYRGSVYCTPIKDLSGRTTYYNQYSHMTSKGDSEKKIQPQREPVQMVVGKTGNTSTETGSRDQKKKNKKGRKYHRMMTLGLRAKDNSTGRSTRSDLKINVRGQLISLDEYLKNMRNGYDEKEVLKSLREAQESIA